MTRSTTVALVLAGAFVATQGASAQQNLGTPKLDVWPVRDGIYVIVGAGGNTTLQVGSDGVLVIDTKLPVASTALLEAIRSVSSKPIRYVVNTHWHGDHIGGLRQLAALLPIGHIYDHGQTVEKGGATERTWPHTRRNARKSHTPF